jgi:hypothetical protein
MFEIPIIRKPLDNHIEFEWKFKFLMKLWKCLLAWWQFFPCGGRETNFDICIMLNLMSNSLSFGKLIKSYILIALSVCDVTFMLPVLHFLWQNRPLYITAVQNASMRPILQPLPILWVWKTYPDGKHSLFWPIDVTDRNEGVFIDTHAGWAGILPWL